MCDNLKNLQTAQLQNRSKYFNNKIQLNHLQIFE